MGTALCEKVWELKDKGKTLVIKWDMVDRAHPYKAGAKARDLYRVEEMQIARYKGVQQATTRMRHSEQVD